jgi:hypothetical protein
MSVGEYNPPLHRTKGAGILRISIAGVYVALPNYGAALRR